MSIRTASTRPALAAARAALALSALLGVAVARADEPSTAAPAEPSAAGMPAPGGARAPSVPEADMAIVLRGALVAYNRELKRASDAKALNADVAATSLARRIAAPLATVAGTINPDARSWHWTVNVETRDEPVAWCLPGGYIMVSTGLLRSIGLTGAEPAVPLAHVIAHALIGNDAREVARQIADPQRSREADPSRTVLRAADALQKLAVGEVHDVADERYADGLSLELLARAGYDPRMSSSAWVKLAANRPARPPVFIALHPTWPERLAEFDARYPAMVELFEQTLHTQARPAPAPGSAGTGPLGTRAR